MFPKTTEKASRGLSKNGTPVLQVKEHEKPRKNASGLAACHPWGGKQRHVLGGFKVQTNLMRRR
jgi:hypothetical protein